MDDNCFDFEEGDNVVLEKNRLLPQFEYNFTVTASKTGKIPQSAWQSVSPQFFIGNLAKEDAWEKLFFVTESGQKQPYRSLLFTALTLLSLVGS